MRIKKGIFDDALYEKLIFFALAVMVVSIPSSRVLMSISQMIFGILWMAHGNYKEKLKAFINNRVALIISSLFLVHLIGVLYSTDLNYALKDLRTKLPMLIVPFMFSSFPKINSRKLDHLLSMFIGAVLLMSLYIAIKHFLTQEPIRVMISRDVFSHIRFSLSLNLALFFIIIKVWKNSFPLIVKVFAIFLFMWLFYFLLILEAFTGIVVFAILFPILLFVMAVYTKRKVVAISLGLIAIGLPIVLCSWLIGFYNTNTTVEQVDLNHLDKQSSSGNYYYHRPNLGTENGKYVYIYVQEKELRSEWNKVSKYNYDSIDCKGQQLKFTLMRYLTSMELRKDKEGVLALSKEDIVNIENGIANIHYTKGLGIEARLMKILLEYENYIRTGDPSGHSVMQRIEYWRTAGNIIQQNFWLGVGTGDMNIAFEDEYNKLDTKLTEKWRLRTHNQYLSIWVGLGLVGFVWFIFVLVYPALFTKSYFNIYFLIFHITLLISMLTEDTIEAQAGLSFYVFFSCIFLIIYQPNNDLRISYREDSAD